MVAEYSTVKQLLKVISELEGELATHKSALYQIRAECQHKFNSIEESTEISRHGNYSLWHRTCVHCGLHQATPLYNEVKTVTKVPVFN